ncbi:hypothetical protein B0H11DRAFT_2286956 [Mycena galericulata]|nr:hypothetical protein B0H11DRAFT_2286956 [Mycena galericulata]
MSSIAEPVLVRQPSANLRCEDSPKDPHRVNDLGDQLPFDLVSRLPFDISSEIFMQCLPTVPHGPLEIFRQHLPAISSLNPSQAPMILLNICRAWTAIALASPALWANIRVQFGALDGSKNLMDTWLDRAHGCSLNLSLRGSFDSEFAASIHKRADQLQCLEVYVRFKETLEYLFEGERLFTSLRSLTIGSRTLDHLRLRADEIVGILRSAPNLTECIFDQISCVPTSGDSLDGLQPLILARLQYLNIGRYRNPRPERPHPKPDAILKYLTLPGLKSLNISRIPDTQILRELMERSSPPLQKLVLCFGELPQRECFQTLAGLTHLELGSGGGQFLANLSVHSPQHFLPHLASFAIRNVVPTATLYDVLLAALTARRQTELQAVDITWKDETEEDIPEHIAMAVQEFVDGGMSIQIGPPH